jgi:hypothetical protein
MNNNLFSIRLLAMVAVLIPSMIWYVNGQPADSTAVYLFPGENPVTHLAIWKTRQGDSSAWSLAGYDDSRWGLSAAGTLWARDGAPGKGEESRTILPKKTLLELGRLLGDGDGDITFAKGENHIFFEVDGRLLVSRMIDGQFPAYERVIPKNNDKRIEFERDRFVSAIRRVALLSNERSRAVKFSLESGRVEVASNSPELGEAREQLAVEYGGPALQISFNAQYVLDFLNAVQTDAIAVEFRDEVSQTVMRPVGTTDYDYTYVVMPMRI